MNICIVSPHIDDALLSCGIAMQRHIAKGDAIFVVNIFSAGTNAENRKEEEKRAQGKMGSIPFFLDELDAPDRNPEYKALTELFFGPLEQAHIPFIERIAARLREFFDAHQIGLAYFPLAAGTHIDHRTAFEAGRRIAHIPVKFYEDRPYILWPGLLQGRMRQIGIAAGLPAVTRERMQESAEDYFYLAHFAPQGAYRDSVLPLYAAPLEHPPVASVNATKEELPATEEELKHLYACLAEYGSQTPHIYGDYRTFLRDSLAHERARTGKDGYIERHWTLESAPEGYKFASESRLRAARFLQAAEKFQLGALPTEQRHPLTHELAALARNDLPAALGILKKIDIGVAAEIAAREKELARLEAAMRDALASGNRVFLYGCGATGRLSLSLEYIWRSLHQGKPEESAVHGFMSGGDLALVHSIENFEDHPEFGARQVQEAGFGPNDLLVACTEGGETPSVIGAAEEAARLSSRKPFFLYCNPGEALRRQVERSRRVLENPGIEKICLFVGPMALSGSTRLQASTALMLGAGMALLKAGGMDAAARNFAGFLEKTDFSFLAPFIEAESRIYAEGGYVLYETDDYGITVLTDTTERSPTFSLLPFENRNDSARIPSLCFLRMPRAQDAAKAWRMILLRDPRALEWDELKAVAGQARLMGFDFSEKALAEREALVAPRPLHRFRIARQNGALCLELGPHRHCQPLEGLNPLFEHLFLKIALNMLSTLVMGRYGRFESNVMTWVKPTNGKLVDRAIRYADDLLHHRGAHGFSYADICFAVFEAAEKTLASGSVVLAAVESLARKGPD